MRTLILEFDVDELHVFDAGAKKFAQTYRDPRGLSVYTNGGTQLIASYSGDNDNNQNCKIAGWFACWRTLWLDSRQTQEESAS